VDEVEQALLAVTGAQVQSAVSGWLNFKDAAAALVGPGVREADLAKLVRG
jgi:hypothetical protein